MGHRPYAWERGYPPSLDWGAPIEVRTLPALLDSAVARHGDRPAIEFEGQVLTYRELRQRIDAAATTLLRMGTGRGTAVAVYLPNTVFHPIAFFAILRVGGRVVHLSPLDSPRMLRYKLLDSGARTLVTLGARPMLDQAIALRAAGLLDHLLIADAGEDSGFAAASCPEGVPLLQEPGSLLEPDPGPEDPDEIALLQYTGGTTGQPKGAILTHANLSAAVGSYRAWFQAIGEAIGPSDRILCVLPLFHIYALTTILLLGLDRGAEILLRSRFDPTRSLDDIERRRATVFPGVPTMWISLARDPAIATRDLSSLRVLSSGGAPLPAEVAATIERLTGRRLTGGWGMTETGPAGTRLPPGRAHAPGLIGLPLPGVELRIVALDDPRRVLDPGEIGELCVRGPNVSPGYWRRPEETAAAFIDGFLLTGDVGCMDADGTFRLVDRKHDMIISGGFNVYPSMVEQAIYEHPAVDEVLVIGVPDDYRGEAAKAYVKLRDGHDRFTLEQLRAFLADRLGRHELPAALEFRAALPRTPVGKLWRRGLIDELARETAARESGDQGAAVNTSAPNTLTPGAPAKPSGESPK